MNTVLRWARSCLSTIPAVTGEDGSSLRILIQQRDRCNPCLGGEPALVPKPVIYWERYF